jgi:hypothetical protein
MFTMEGVMPSGATPVLGFPVIEEPVALMAAGKMTKVRVPLDIEALAAVKVLIPAGLDLK